MSTMTDFMPSAELAALYSVTQSAVSRLAPDGGVLRGYEIECEPADEDFRDAWGKTERTKWMFRGPLPAEALELEVARLRPALAAARCRLGGHCDTYPDCDHHHGMHACVVCGDSGRVQASAAKAHELQRDIESLRETIANLRRTPDTREVQLLRKLESTMRDLRDERRAVDSSLGDDGHPSLKYCQAQVRRLKADVDHLMDKLDDLRRAERRSA